MGINIIYYEPKMKVKKLVVGPLGTNCYILADEKNHISIIIDPGGDKEKIKKVIENMDTEPKAILLTHAHHDHTGAVKRLKTHYKIPLMYNKTEYDSGIFSLPKADRWLQEGDEVKVGEHTLHVLETPGHTSGSLSFYTTNVSRYKESSTDAIIFTGDLLFKRSIGRTDFEGGNQEQLFSSIRNKIANNPKFSNETIILPGHMGQTTLGFEKEYNFYRNYFL
jgi:glyoxylase-like metal-dependent hydrolase (beta-lactamase superfamily II)